MRILSLLAFVGAVLLVCGSVHAVDINTTFTDSLSGWSGVGVTHSPTSGNPGGYARFDDSPGSGASFIVAPPAYAGDWSSYKDVGALSYDHRIIAADNANFFVDYQINIYGPNDSASWFYPPASGVTSWLRRVAPLKESEWILSDDADWERLLSNVTKLEIRIEHVDNFSGFNIEGIDNVKLFVQVPEPSSSAMLLSLTLLVGAARVRRPGAGGIERGGFKRPTFAPDLCLHSP